MSAALRTHWTIPDFLAWEERQEFRHEFDGFQPVAMTGGTFAHDAVQTNLVAALHARLQGKPCRVHGNSLKIQVMGSIRYPDAFVTCAPRPKLDATVVHEPVVIFEVISRSTHRTDRMVKNREYAGTGSVVRYVILEQAAIEATVFARGPDGDWTGRLLGADAVLAMPEIGIELPLAECYTGLELTGTDPEADI